MRTFDRVTRTGKLKNGFAVVAATLVALMAIAPVALAADPGTLVLRTAPEGKVLTLGDIAAADNLGVVWQEGRLSFLRWSTNGGASFAPKVALRSGLRATNPRLAACGDFLWAASVWRTKDAAKIGIDYRQVSLGSTGAGRFVVAPGFNPDVACRGDLVAVTWVDYADRLRIGIFDGPCASSCGPAYEADLGQAPEFNRATIAATDRGFVVAWEASGIAVQRVVVENDGGTLDVELRPLVVLLAGTPAWSPLVAADGARVVVAYRRFGQTHMKISEDRGRTFGSRVIVSEYCRKCPEGGSGPASVDIRSGSILIEVTSGMGIPPGVDERGFLTTNDGQSWSHTPTHTGGAQMGVFHGAMLAEAWDRHVYADPVYDGGVPQKLRFHRLALP